MGFEAGDFRRLDDTKHMLEFLYDEPYQQIFEEVEGVLNGQIAGSRLQTFCVTSDPDWLTRLVKEDDNRHAIVKGAGVAFEFRLMVLANKTEYQLSGVWTSVGYHLDTPSAQRQIWLDIDGTLDEFGKDGALMERVYLQ